MYKGFRFEFPPHIIDDYGREHWRTIILDEETDDEGNITEFVVAIYDTSYKDSVCLSESGEFVCDEHLAEVELFLENYSSYADAFDKFFGLVTFELNKIENSFNLFDKTRCEN
jgi:hypothetical protein